MKLRTRLFDGVVMSVPSYAAEIWGWKEYAGIEIVQNKYTRWTLKLERSTPMHIVMSETERPKIVTRTGTRTMKYEQKLRRAYEGILLEECWRMRVKKGKKICAGR